MGQELHRIEEQRLALLEFREIYNAHLADRAARVHLLDRLSPEPTSTCRLGGIGFNSVSHQLWALQPILVSTWAALTPETSTAPANLLAAAGFRVHAQSK